ncbi:hypothetical protein F1C58_11660 [Glaciihabitans sp. INWT7]|uniref:hypothetical protein n=1 Tax=Glaciihabitans sp. INWT7 TaxID=2596912 RepID=UPI0016249C24|nr:hypothetical protein [Glaciihabitans sp. INWT7]QNE47494.1 hypothetical protein F1C58_11660 [Glaciihabitans sp. INWT7]
MDAAGHDDIEYEQNGRRAMVRYTPEDAEWNIFAPSGVYVATFAESPSTKAGDATAPLYQLITNRTSPRATESDHRSADWRGLVERALIDFDGFAGADDLIGE